MPPQPIGRTKSVLPWVSRDAPLPRVTTFALEMRRTSVLVRQTLSVGFIALGFACKADNGADLRSITSAAKPSPTVLMTATRKRTDATRGIQKPLRTDTSGLAMVDRVDVGNDQDERAHQYVIQSPTFRGLREFDAVDDAVYIEDGRATASFETFKMKVIPNQENLLIKAFDTLAKDQRVRVILDGTALGEWVAPDGGASRYGEATFSIPATVIRDRIEVNVRLEYVSGAPDTNAFVYWVFAKPGKTLDGPLSTDLTGLTLTDRLDVGGAADEARHGYVIDKVSYTGVQQFAWPKTGLPFFENGRATRSFESFKMKATPGRDHLLVKAFDTYSKKQVVRVLVDGRVVGTWALPDEAARYGEGSFRIPGSFVSAEEINVRVEFVSASLDCNSFVYWLYADSHGRK
jgi:hypothetical protein